MRPCAMVEVHNGKRYNTETALLVAGDDWWDGHNYERHGRNRFLYRTRKGNYFVQYLTQWEGERSRLEPISKAEAIYLYEEELLDHRVDFEEAFPDVEVAEA